MNKKIKKHLQEIREAIGPRCGHEKHGGFGFYIRGDFVTVSPLGETPIREISCHRIYDNDCSIEVEFELGKSIPTKKEILKAVEAAKSAAVKFGKEIRKRSEADIKREIKSLKSRLKELGGDQK
jgi:hypothetical protein